MKFKFKKYLAILLCMTMVFSSTLPHFASDDLTNKEETSATYEESSESVEKSSESTDESESIESSSSVEEPEGEDGESESKAEEEPESDEPESSETESSETESSETESSEAETEESESTEASTEAEETSVSESTYDEEKVASSSEIAEEENDSEEKYDDIDVATNSDALKTNLVEYINDIATKSELTTVNDYEIGGLGFIPNDFDIPVVEKRPLKRGEKLLGALPEASYDPRGQNTPYGLPILPPMRDQGSYGTCWAFFNYRYV